MRAPLRIAALISTLVLIPIPAAWDDSPYVCDPGSGAEIPCDDPWSLSFTPGELVYDPPEEFCDYFPCTADYGAWDGYLVQCADLLFDRSGGTSRSCAGHGGPFRTLYQALTR